MKTLKVLAAFFITFYLTIGTAGVEDIIQSQKDIRNAEQKSKKADNIVLANKRSAIDQGKYEFGLSCAVCHGTNGKGKGDFSSQLAYKPSDLTQIKKMNSGIFPAIKIYDVIDGQTGSNTHGSRTMPIWGNRYEAESWLDVSPKFAGTITRGKIFEIILYLNTIQE